MSENPFLKLRSFGYQNVLPIVPPGVPVTAQSGMAKALKKGKDDRGKVPGIKKPSGEWTGLGEWQSIVANEGQMRAWFDMGAGVGLRFGDGFIGIDIDASDQAVADQIEADALEAFGPSPMRVGRWPRRALIYRITEDTPYRSVIFTGPEGLEKIECMSVGKQMVMAGVHPKTGQLYKWRRPLVPADELSLITPAMLDAFLFAQEVKLPNGGFHKDSLPTERPEDQSKLRGDPGQIAEAMRAMPNDRVIFPLREDYIRMGAALKASLPDDEALAYELWTEWAALDDGGEPELWAKDWKGLKAPFAIGSDWIYTKAQKLDPTRQFIKGKDMLADEGPDEPARSTENSSKSSKFNLEKFDDIKVNSIVSAPALIKGLLDQGAMSVGYGDSNAGKTFVFMDMAFHVGAGLSYAGLRTKQGLVVYVAAEGGQGAKKRIVALKDRYPGAGAKFLLLASPVDLRNAKADLEPLIATIKGLDEPVALLVIDTLSRAMAGGDENSSVDMGNLVKHFDKLRQAIAPAHLLVVHHSGKDKAKGARGHSLLRAATDTEIEVAAQGKDGTPGMIAVTKQRDMDGEWARPFRLRVHKLGLDADGDVLTSCTVNLLEGEEAVAAHKRPTEKERDVLIALSNLTPDSGEGVFSADEIAAQMMEGPAKMSVEAVRQNLRRMALKGLVVRPEQGKWALRPSDDRLNGICMIEEEKDTAVQDRSKTVQETNSGIFD